MAAEWRVSAFSFYYLCLPWLPLLDRVRDCFLRAGIKLPAFVRLRHASSWATPLRSTYNAWTSFAKLFVGIWGTEVLYHS